MSGRARAAAIALIAAVAVAGAACSSAPGDAAATGRQTRLTVLAAASLTNVLPRIADAFSRGHPGTTFAFSFAGTDQLAAQIQQGAPADVFAGASERFADELSSAHLVDDVHAFCTNRLVVVVPAADPGGIHDPADLARRGVKLVVGAPTLPVGAYTRQVLEALDATLGAAYSRSVLANVVSEEDSVTSVLAKVESGEADAGFVYVTDARSAGTRVATLSLPASAQAVATYPAAVVAASRHAATARAFVAFLLTRDAQALLRDAGFGAPPAP